MVEMDEIKNTTANRDGLTGFFTDEVRLSHLSAEASRRHDHVALRFLRAGQAGRVLRGSVNIMQPLFTPAVPCSFYGGLAGNSETTVSIA